jgi:hypothetical protein
MHWIAPSEKNTARAALEKLRRASLMNACQTGAP